MKVSQLKNIIREEVSKLINEISDYDRSLIPKDTPWSDDEIIDYLDDIGTITGITNSVVYRKDKKSQYGEELKYIKSALIEFILKYKFNDGENLESLDTKTISELEEYIPNLTANMKDEYSDMVHTFATDLVYNNLIDTESYYDIN